MTTSNLTTPGTAGHEFGGDKGKQGGGSVPTLESFIFKFGPKFGPELFEMGMQPDQAQRLYDYAMSHSCTLSFARSAMAQEALMPKPAAQPKRVTDAEVEAFAKKRGLSLPMARAALSQRLPADVARN